MFWETLIYYFDPKNMLFTRTIVTLILIIITVLDGLLNMTFKMLFMRTIVDITQKKHAFRCHLYREIERLIKPAPRNTFDKIKQSIGLYHKTNQKDRKFLDEIVSVLEKNKTQSCCDPNQCSAHPQMKDKIQSERNIDTKEIDAPSVSSCPIFIGLKEGANIDDMNDMWNVIWRGCAVRGQQINFFWGITIQILLFFGSLKGLSLASNTDAINNMISLAEYFAILVCLFLLAVSYGSSRPITLYERRGLRLLFLGILFTLMIYFSTIINNYTIKG